MLLSKDAVADVIEVRARHRLLHPQARDHLRRHPRPVLARRADRRHRGHRRADQDRRAHARGRRRIPAHAHRRSCRPRRTPATTRSIVAEKAVLRRLVEAGTRIVQMGYASEGEVVDLVNNAQAEIYAVTGGVESEDYVPLTDAVTAAIDEIEAARGRDGSMIGVPDRASPSWTSSRTVCTPASSSSSPLVPRSVSRPSRSTSRGPPRSSTTCRRSSSRSKWGAARSRCACCRPRHPCRCSTCARARVHTSDWTTIAATRGRINDAPLYIDDSPNMTLVEIRAKCRRLKQRVGLKMVIIDYLQLMTSGKKVESPPAGGQRVLPCAQAAREGARRAGRSRSHS